MAGLANYAALTDIPPYLPNSDTAAEAPIWGTLCGVASRAIDRWTDRFLFPDTAGTKYFDVDGDPTSGTLITRLQLQKHDFYTLTALKVATRENADPGVAGDWVTLAGDGVTPPSDFFLEPANEVYIGRTGDTHTKPFYRIELPTTPPSSSSTFQASLMPGKRTLAITASWGWPAIPDEITNLAVKLVVRMWKAKEAGWTGAVGSPEFGTQVIQRYLDLDDISTLNGYKKYGVA